MKSVLDLFAPLARTLRTAAIACDGAAAVETALVLPVFLLCVFGISEIGRALWIQSTLQYAVEDAARCAAINTASAAARALSSLMPLAAHSG